MQLSPPDLSIAVSHVIESACGTDLADTYAFSQAGFFFNEPIHLRQQGEKAFTLLAVNQLTGRTDGRCTFFLRGQQAVSPLAAPFGSIEFSPSLPDDVLNELIRQLIESARTAGATSVRLVNYPGCYAPEQTARLLRQLTRHGFQTTATHENFHLSITPQAFEHYIAPAEQRRLRKCQTAGFRFAQWFSPDLCTVTRFIGQVHQQRNHAETIAPAQLTKLIQTFPDRFPVFGAWDVDRLIALAIAVRVSPTMLYYFLPVSDPAYDAYSPMVLLIDGLWTYCQQQSIALLDLGVSLNSDRTPKPSLMQFKRHLGAQLSLKTTVERLL